MKLENVSSVVQEAVAQTMGTEYMEKVGAISPLDAAKLVDIGKNITETTMTTEKFTKALVSILGRREIDGLTYTPLYSDIIVNRVEWGGFIERVKIDMADIMDSPMFALENKKSYSDIEHTFYQPKVISKIYEEGKGIMIPISIQSEMLTESFTSWDRMNEYLTKIRAVIRETLKIAMDRYASILVEGAIAISDKATQTSVHLLTEAIAEGILPEATTAEQALKKEEFLVYASRRIAQIRDNMKVRTVAYNNGKIPMQSSDNNLYLLSEFARNLKFAKSGIYNEQMIDFGESKSIPMWQGITSSEQTKDFDFANTSVISLAADPTNKLGIGTEAVKISNVIGLLFDRKAIGITIYKEKMTSSYTASADFWNEYLHALTNQIIDSDYPMVAFILD